ncbi:MAG: hypothetical protein Q8Q37_01250 [bacterium]|nr:hypothetical protein [bacterium]
MADQKGGKKPVGNKKGGNEASWLYIISAPLILAILVALPFIPKLLGGDYLAVKLWSGYVLKIWRLLAPFFIVVDVALVVTAVYLLFVIWPINPRVSMAGIFKKRHKKAMDKNPKLIQRWKEIQQKIATGNPENLRLAVVASDALVDAWLKKSGYQGDSFAERVSVIRSDQVKSFNAMWQAHRLRNDLVHNPEFTLSANQAKDAITAYENFLKEMGAL